MTNVKPTQLQARERAEPVPSPQPQLGQHAENGDWGSNDLLMSDVLGRHEV